MKAKNIFYENYKLGKLIWLTGLILFIFVYRDLLWYIANDIIPMFWHNSPLMLCIILLIMLIGRSKMKEAKIRLYWEKFDAQYDRLKKSAMKSVMDGMNKFSRN